MDGTVEMQLKYALRKIIIKSPISYHQILDSEILEVERMMIDIHVEFPDGLQDCVLY